MAFTTAGQNAALSGGLGNVITHVGLLTDAAVELSGGSPTYARRAVTWAAAGSGLRASSLDITPFDVPGATIALLGFYSQATAGTLYGSTPLGGFEVEAASVLASTDQLTDYSHGLAVGNRVFVHTVHTNGLPTGFATATLYYVASVPTTDTFTLSATSGGSAVNVTASGKVLYQRCAPVVTSSQSTLPFTAGNIVLDARLLG